MPAHLEITGGIIRFSHRLDWRYGEPYDFAIVVDPVDAETVVLKGFAGVPSKHSLHGIKALLRRYGWRTVQWERYRDGKAYLVSRSLASFSEHEEPAAAARRRSIAALCSGSLESSADALL
jgi:hypothetical protein